MKKALSRCTLYGVVLGLTTFAGTSAADHDRDDDDGSPAVQPPEGRQVRPQEPERELRQIVRDIDKHRTEASIRTLVSFGTRHLESSQTDPNRGIGAATKYIFSTMQGFAA